MEVVDHMKPHVRLPAKKPLGPLLLSLAAGIGMNGVTPAWCQLDSFELPPGIEQTRIPKRLRPTSPVYKPKVSPEEIRRIETLRQDIERAFGSKNYAEAEPFYSQYVAALEKVGIDDSRLATALQNYAALLRKLKKDAEAQTVEIKANAILTRSGAAQLTYGLKEYRLGMSLDEWARLQPPGGDVKKVKGICSCDAGQTVEPLSDDDKRAKVVQCGFWELGPDGSVKGPHSLTVANIQCEPDFRFVEDDGVYRLYEISIAFYNSNFDTIRKALVEKYGEPSGREVEKLKTDMGNNYPLTNLIWDNGVSKIRLTNAEGTNTGRAKLRYIHRVLFLAYAKRVNEVKDTPGKQAATDL
jgi:hypothetical protein